MQDVVFQTIDENVWDDKYADKFGTLPYGISMKQGPREEMEDFAHIIPRARCGFLFAGALPCLWPRRCTRSQSIDASASYALLFVLPPVLCAR